MIFPDQAVRIVIATKPVDFRKGHDGLAAMAHGELGFAPKAGVMVTLVSATELSELEQATRTAAATTEDTNAMRRVTQEANMRNSKREERAYQGMKLF